LVAKSIVLVAGSGCHGVAEAAAKVAGVAKVHVADDAAYAIPAGRKCRAAGRRPDGATTTLLVAPQPHTARISRRASPRCST
jgi:hypothetical protein